MYGVPSKSNKKKKKNLSSQWRKEQDPDPHPAPDSLVRVMDPQHWEDIYLKAGLAGDVYEGAGAPRPLPDQQPGCLPHCSPLKVKGSNAELHESRWGVFHSATEEYDTGYN
jgi:hypothetical protein